MSTKILLVLRDYLELLPTGLLLFAQSCVDLSDKPAKGHSKGEEIVQKIAEEAGVKSQRFFLLSPDVCLTCIDEKVERIYGELNENLDFIMLGGDLSHIRMLNAIYRRKGLKFSLCSDTAWQQLTKVDRRFSMGVFVGAKRWPDGRILLYDGFDIPAPRRVEAVLEFCAE